MNVSWRRTLRPLVLSLTVAVLAGLTTVAPAGAAAVSSGSFAFSGDPDDYVSLGQAYAYSTDAGDHIAMQSERPGHVKISTQGLNGDWWYLDLAAPVGETLERGKYTRATRYPFSDTTPGLALDGNGRGCNQVTGSFTILGITTSPTGRVETLDATFEHHCEGGRSAARGEVHVVAGPEQPPIPLLTLDAPTVAGTGTADGRYGLGRVHGTVACSKPTEVLVEGSLTQTVRREQVVGSFFAQVWCEPGAPVAWTGVASGGTASGSKVEFQRGDATVAVRASAWDGDYATVVASSPVTAQVTLLRTR